MRPLTRLPILLLAGIAAAGADSPPADFAQAERMLSLLKAAKSGKTRPGQIRAVLDSSGTDLVVRQMNISRRVTKEQYATLLRALAGGNQPEIRPADSSEKAGRGADGLQENVWPSLLWGKQHTDLLEERIATLRKADLPGDAQAIAQRFLPEKVPISPRVAIVMGGRAGAAALEGSWIYFDVLAACRHFRCGACRQGRQARRVIIVQEVR